MVDGGKDGNEGKVEMRKKWMKDGREEEGKQRVEGRGEGEE